VTVRCRDTREQPSVAIADQLANAKSNTV